MGYPTTIYCEPRFYYLLTCPLKLWAEMRKDGDTSEAGGRYRKLRRRHIDKLIKVLEFNHANYIFAAALQDITIKSFGRNNRDWINIPKEFSQLNPKDIRSSFADANEAGRVFVALSAYEKNKKNCFLSLFVPYYNNIYVQLTKNHRDAAKIGETDSGVIVFNTVEKSALEEKCTNNSLPRLSDCEVPIIKHHFRKLEQVLNS